jgi:hypothetical protein
MSASSQQVASRQPNRQSESADGEYDEYVYYPYYPKSVPGGGYEYVPELQDVEEYEEGPVEYVIERPPKTTTVVQRT